ncbi:hypothetical protein PENTCL1PPCAC_21049, partial [Pristionchus entomophagus]
ECHHSIEESCTIDKDTGYCYHNKDTGEFICDESGFCANKMPGIRQAGCWKEENPSDSLEGKTTAKPPAHPASRFIHLRPFSHKTIFSQIEGHDDQKFKDCEDPFCYAYISKEDGGLTSAWIGCMATTMVRYNMFKKEDALYKNNSRWESYQYLMDMSRCEDIVSDEEYRNGTGPTHVAKCVEYDKEDAEMETVTMRRLCCCKGKNYCNDEFGWDSPAITMEQAKDNKAMRLASMKVADGSTVYLFSLSFLSLLALFVLN